MIRKKMLERYADEEIKSQPITSTSTTIRKSTKKKLNQLAQEPRVSQVTGELNRPMMSTPNSETYLDSISRGKNCVHKR